MSFSDCGWVYLVRAGETDYYKIGRTSRLVEERVKDMQTSSPHTLKIVGRCACRDPKQTEALLHDAWEICQHRGEWFVIPPGEAKHLINVLNSFHHHTTKNRLIQAETYVN